MPAWLDIRDTGFEAAFAALLAARCETADGVDDTVAAILADVKANGDVAVIAH
ncbi:MAG: histidinol dehydrogenase, partial [Proteobacteria bacterium]|nr:histidinol dehydrogenase [Pseudomonadota bacterium]